MNRDEKIAKVADMLWVRGIGSKAGGKTAAEAIVDALDNCGGSVELVEAEPIHNLTHPLTPGSLVTVQAPQGSTYNGMTGQVIRVVDREDGRPTVFVQLWGMTSAPQPFSPEELTN